MNSHPDTQFYIKDLAALKNAFIFTEQLRSARHYMDRPAVEVFCEANFWRACFANRVYPETLVVALAVDRLTQVAAANALGAVKGDMAEPFMADPGEDVADVARSPYFHESLGDTFPSLKGRTDPGAFRRWMNGATEQAAQDPMFWVALLRDKELSWNFDARLIALVGSSEYPRIGTAVIEASLVRAERAA